MEQTARNKRSEKMTKEEHKAFLNYVKSFDTLTDAVETLGFSRVTLDKVMYKGSGKPETINLIRSKLQSVA